LSGTRDAFVTNLQSGTTAVTLSSFTARTDGETVALQWRTGYEVNNLGFHLYREEGGQLYRLTPELVAGSALLAGTGTPLTAGRSYVWYDYIGPPGLEDRPSALRSGPPGLEARGKTSDPDFTSSEAILKSRHGRDAPQAQRSAVFWLEDWDLNGQRTRYGPITPVLSETPLPEQNRSALLSGIGKRQDKKYDDFRRIRDLREKLKKTVAVAERPSVSRSGPSALDAGGQDLKSRFYLKRSGPRAQRSSRERNSRSSSGTLLKRQRSFISVDPGLAVCHKTRR